MPIVGFAITKISGERKKESFDKLNIKSNLEISDIKEDKINVGKEQNVLKISFNFTVNYEPDVANLGLSGYIYYLEEDKKMKEILNNWKSKKTLDRKLMERLFTAILTRCNIKALILSQDLNLPPHIRLPVVVSQPAQGKKDYIG